MRLRAHTNVRMKVMCQMTLTQSMSGSVCEHKWEDLGFEQTGGISREFVPIHLRLNYKLFYSTSTLDRSFGFVNTFGIKYKH